MTEVDAAELPVFLLGAGASAEAGVPLAREMTGQLLEQFAVTRWGYAHALNFVVGAIIAYDTQRGGRADALPDIERVVSAVELLHERDRLEVAPFVSAWAPTVEALEQPRPGSAASAGATLVQSLGLHRATLAGHQHQVSAGAVQRAIEQMIDARIGGPRQRVFGALLSDLVGRLVGLLHLPDPGRVAYLQPLVSVPAAPIVVGTLNYDTSVELAADAAGAAWSTGIDDWSESGELAWPERGVRLYKLHGSVSWGRVNLARSAPEDLRLPQEVLQPLAEASYGMPFVIFGQREKLRPVGPFLQLLEGFRSELNRARDLVAIGYGFRDDHINAMVTQWLNGSQERRLTVVDPYFPDSPLPGEFRHTMQWSLQHRTGPWPQHVDATRLVIIREPASTSLAQMFAGDPTHYLDEAFARAVAAEDPPPAETVDVGDSGVEAGSQVTDSAQEGGATRAE